MKKKIILILIIIIAIVLVIGYIFYNRARTIEEITKVSLDDIAYIESGRGVINLTLDDFLQEYKEAKFKRCTEFHNSTVAEDSIIAYDESGQVLLTLKIGNDYKIVAGEYDANNPSKRYKKVN